MSSNPLNGITPTTPPADAGPPLPPAVAAAATSSTVVHNTSPGIRCQHVRRFFGTVPAVVDVSFEAPAGTVTGLIGPNGSGKTTLLLMLAGLLKPDAGEVVISGLNIAKWPQQTRALIGWMPDVSGTWDALSCTEILTFFGQAYGLSKAAAKDRAKVLLATVYLSEYATAPARVLSRGQKQRLGLARALVHDPQVLLLDEPASGLDPRSRIELRDLLRALAAGDKTILLSSHVLAEMDEIVDSAVFVTGGRDVSLSSAQTAMTQRGWRLAALDQAALTRFLDAHAVVWQPSTAHSGEVTVNLPSPDSAAALLRDLVAAGVPMHTVAPVSGRLEEAYLALNEERL